jgi:periplasmic protein TonB
LKFLGPPVQIDPRRDAYSPREIAMAACVPEEDVSALIGRRAYVPYTVALRVARSLRHQQAAAPAPSGALFLVFGSRRWRKRTTPVPLVLSSTLHIGLVALAGLVTTLTTTPTATTMSASHPERTRLVFLAEPGPGGGGGGGGQLQTPPPPRSLREGHHLVSSPLPVRIPPRPIQQVPARAEPTPPPLNPEPLPPVAAPIVSAAADSRNRNGTLEPARAEADSHGSGQGGGAGPGTGTGVGSGDGPGIGQGSGGGAGGGPYRGGSGIDPPRLIHEVKPDYTEDARRRGITGDVILEIVVQRDGSVGDVTVLQGLGWGLDDRATQAVRQWGFAAARRQGSPVDVIVEVAVEFKIR